MKMPFCGLPVKNSWLMKKTTKFQNGQFDVSCFLHHVKIPQHFHENNSFLCVVRIKIYSKTCYSRKNTFLWLDSSEFRVDEEKNKVSKWTVWCFMFSSSCQNSSPFAWKITISVLHKKINWAFQNPNCRLPSMYFQKSGKVVKWKIIIVVAWHLK